MARLVRVGARQQRHQVRAGGVRDPGLVAVDAVDLAVAFRAGAQRGEVGAGLRLGEDRGRNDLAGGDPGQIVRLLILGAGEADELAGDLSPRPQRADPDIAARELFGDDAHRRLAEAEAAVALRHRHAEDAEPGEVADDGIRYQRVARMPVGRGIDDVLRHIAPELRADRAGGLVQAVVQEGALRPRSAQPVDQNTARLGRRALRDDRRDGRGGQEGRGLGLRAEMHRAHDLVLAHGDAVGELQGVLRPADRRDGALDSAKDPPARQILDPARQPLQRRNIGRDPGETVRLDLAFGDGGARDRAVRPAVGGDQLGLHGVAIGGGRVGERAKRPGIVSVSHGGRPSTTRRPAG